MRQSERGIAIVWLLGLIVVFGGLAALTIDILRLQAILRQAQNAADAAALAGSRQFDGKVSGWGRAKRTAVETLRNQHISGVSSSNLGDLTFDDEAGAQDYFEHVLEREGDSSAQRYLSTLGHLGPYRVYIERGSYWQSGFTSLEGVTPGSGQTLSDVARPITYLGFPGIDQIPVRYDVPVHLLANAVRVRVEISGIRAFFGKFVGISEFATSARDSVSVSDPALAYPVAPIAIPACALLLDTDGAASLTYQYDTEEFTPAKQCIREATFTEANPLAPSDGTVVSSSYDQRAHGIFRAQSYPERTTKRTLPIYGVLGLPSAGVTAEGPNQTIKPQQLVDALQKLAEQGSSSFAVSATLGDFFYPLENGVFPGGFLNRNFPYAADASTHLRAMLEHDGELFTSVFEPSATDHAGYPKLRTEGSSNDKFIKMGPDVTLRMKQFPIPNLQFPPMNNPLCTDPELRSMPFAERKAIEVNVMVISPTEVQDDGTPSYRYCDYKAVFDGAEQDTSAPKGLTKPRIVGFVRAHLFDFRLTPYEGGTGGDNGTGENPNSGNPAGAVMSGKYKTFMEKGKVFVEEHKEWRECRRAAASCPRFPPFPAGCPINCGGGPSKPSIPNSTSYEKLNSFNCFEMPEWNFLSGCVNNPSDANFSQCQSQFALGLAENGFPQRPEIIAAGNACLPRKIPGCSLPDENPACWEAPDHFKPQFGCGGIRGRLSCGDARLTTPGSAALRRPSLVN